MRLSKVPYLLDLNVLIALSDDEHERYETAMRWFVAEDRRQWALCPLTEAGFVRVTTNPLVGRRTVEEAMAVLDKMAQFPGYRFWPITDRWTALVEPFSERIFGHQQITDAYLLGLAVKEDGVLVTMDKAIKYLAGAQYTRHVLVLE